MAFRALFAAAAASVALTGCYVDTLDDRPPGTPVTTAGDKAPADTGDCHYGIGKGCFDGYLVSKKEFFIDGKQFFNADDLATRFHELITVENAGQALALGEGGYQLALTTPLDNQSFVSGFEYYLTGSTARSGKLRTDGNFSISDLPEGTYDLRVQKSVKFTLTTQAAKVEQPGATGGAQTGTAGTDGAKTGTAGTGDVQTGTAGTDDAKTGTAAAGGAQALLASLPATEAPGAVTKSFCATLYADTVVEVRKGARVWDTFGDFRLHVTDNECAAGGNQTTLSLNP